MATLTVYPDAGTGATTVDGYSYLTEGTWAQAYSASAGTTTNATAAALYAGGEYPSAGNWRIYRTFILFDTSALGAGATISAATLSLYDDNTGNETESTYPSNPLIFSSSPASNNALVHGDFDQVGNTSFCDSAPTLATFNGSSAYNDFAFNASGLTAISKTDITKLSVRGANDFNNTAPTARSYAAIKSADVAGTTSDPKLVITYTTASTFVPTIIIT